MIAEYHIDISDSGNHAPDLLADASGLSKSQIKQAMQKGAVWITDDKGTRRLRRVKKELPVDTKLHFYHNPEVLSLLAQPPSLFADESDYSVWIKPRGVLSQGSKWSDHSTITRQIEINDKKQRPAFLVHRLDRAATGLMLIGHSKKATQMLTAMFAKKTIQKTYRASVKGQFSDSGDKLTFNTEIDGRSAVTHARLLAFDPELNQSLVELKIETGRKHQIRKHLSEAGYPVIGDRLYGGGDQQDLQLTAVSLTFECPLSGDFKEYNLLNYDDQRSHRNI